MWLALFTKEGSWGSGRLRNIPQASQAVSKDPDFEAMSGWLLKTSLQILSHQRLSCYQVTSSRARQWVSVQSTSGKWVKNEWVSERIKWLQDYGREPKRFPLWPQHPSFSSHSFCNLKGDPAKFAQLIRPCNSPAPFICNPNTNRKQGLR